MAAFALLLSVSAQAQFTASTIAETTAGAATNVTKTTNDSRPYRVNAGDPLNTLNVIAWDGGSPTVYYFVPVVGTVGSFALPAGASYPDLVLSTATSTLNPYLVIVFRLGGNFVFRAYKWTGVFTLSSSVTWADAAGTFTPSINVDATANGDYAVTIGRSNGSIEVRTGTNASLPAPPAISVATLPTGTGHQTDICVNTSPVTGTTNVHLSYTNGANTVVFTRAAPFAGLAFGIPVVAAPAIASTTYADPRIASPNKNAPACPATDVYSIIYDEINSVTPFYFIHLYSVENLGTTNKVLSGGAAGFPTPAIQFSKRPVLTYNEKFSYAFASPNNCSGAIITAWQVSMTSRSLIGEKLRSDGVIFGPVTYYDINNPIRTGCDMSSISSKYTSDRVLLAFYDGSGSRVLYKYFGYGAATMRTMGTSATAAELEKDIEVFPNPASDHIYLSYSNINPEALINVHVTDITGRVSYSYKGEMAVLQAQVNNWFQLLASGVYYLQCNDGEGFSKALKIVKQ